MKLEGFQLSAIDWREAKSTEVPGATGTATMRAYQVGLAQLRIVEYGAGYLADHWCSKGHIIHVLAGALVIEHRDGRCFRLDEGMSYTVADEDGAPHRAKCERGATVFIVD
jgi:hypothetical protein